ncbi:GAP family protein [Streptomyces hirsutus]|uniref:GAP family protein n=1 Tax=Streptomyces hirsutus TaxID=35620 RepID=UPI001F0ADF61|nr:GAP family protein [Streptomyces hirsutus]
MGEVLGDVPGLAAGGAASPFPIDAVIIVPATPRGRVNGLVFVTGWVVGLSVLGAVMPAIGGKGSADPHGQPADRVGAFKLALGVALASFRGEVVASSPCRCHAGTAAAMDGRDRPLHAGEELPSRPRSSVWVFVQFRGVVGPLGSVNGQHWVRRRPSLLIW